MAVTEAQVEALLFSALQAELGGSGKEVVKYRRKLSKAFAKTMVAVVRMIDDSNAGEHF